MNPISRQAFKVLLFCIYIAFFAVQNCLRFSYPHTDISYQLLINRLKSADSKTKDAHGTIAQNKLDTRHKKTGWLNKRYSPEPIIAVAHTSNLPDLPYFILKKQFYTYRQIVINRVLLHSSLRAPPAIS
jgi:hypothetical protein